MIYKSSLLFLIVFLSLTGFGQAMDNNASFRMVNAEKYIRIQYDNDYFSNGDKYYSQGILLESVSPNYQKVPLTRLLLASKRGHNQYGIALEHNGYTPTSIRHPEILKGDRPFAAAVFLKLFSSGVLPSGNARMTSSFSLGVIGPAAGGKEIQETLHKWVHDEAPLGWQNQIRNDLILNYEAGIERNLLHSGNMFLLNVLANAKIGTLSTKLSGGMTLMVGKLNSLLTSIFAATERKQDKFSIHLYAQPLVNIVGYDATMQGGIFNRSSPYTIVRSDIKHITYQQNFGINCQIGAVNLEYSKTIVSREFSSGSQHAWGGVRIGIRLK